jgi:hypothetical protein
MADKPTEDPPLTPETPAVPKKTRAKKKPSNFLVLKDVNAGRKDGAVSDTYTVVASNGNLKSCRKKIIAEKLEGELVIVCVRQRVTTKLQQALVFE